MPINSWNEVDTRVTTKEKVLSGGYAGLAGIGTTALLSTATWFTVTPSASAGLGVAIAGTTAAATFAGVGIISGAAAVPIAWYTYKGLTEDANALAEKIPKLISDIEQHHEKLFYELLRLRCLSKNEKEYKVVVAGLNLKSIPANHDALMALVNTTYQKIKTKVHDNHELPLTALLQNSAIASTDKLRQDILQTIKIADPAHFEKQLHDCFEHIANPGIVKRAVAAMYGIISGLTVSGATLGVGWSFAALVIGAGLTASIPVFGWAIFAAVCISLGIAFGTGMGLEKQKNLQREALIDLLILKSSQLESDREKVIDVCINKTLLLMKQDAAPSESLKTTQLIITKSTLTKHKTHQALHTHGLLAKKVPKSNRSTLDAHLKRSNSW